LKLMWAFDFLGMLHYRFQKAIVKLTTTTHQQLLIQRVAES
jgi:hypothetical protein